MPENEYYDGARKPEMKHSGTIFAYFAVTILLAMANIGFLNASVWGFLACSFVSVPIVLIGRNLLGLEEERDDA